MTNDHGADHQDLLALGDLLETERSALLQGNLDGLLPILAAKEHLIQALNERKSASGAEIASLQIKITRNHALIEGALMGIRTAAARLAAHRGLRRSMSTYDRQGRKHSISAERGNKVEKRA